jgi:Ca2+-binding EF-hand superfamily protein
MTKTQYTLTALAALLIGSGTALAGTAGADGDCEHEGGKHKGGEQRINRLDTDENGKVTLAELTTARESWLAKADTNKDGAVTQAEIDATRESAHKERVDKVLEHKDADKDGRLTKAEAQMPERWFAKVDANNDGVLSKEELAAGPRRAGKAGADAARGGRHGGMFAHLDLNKDGKVDKAEVQQAAAEMLKRLDKNADGTLSADELRGFRQRGPHGQDHDGNGPKPTEVPKGTQAS